MGIAWVTFDSNSKTANGSSRIFVGVANMGSDNVFVSEDNGATWSAVAGQRNDFIPHHGMISARSILCCDINVYISFDIRCILALG